MNNTSCVYLKKTNNYYAPCVYKMGVSNYKNDNIITLGLMYNKPILR